MFVEVYVHKKAWVCKSTNYKTANHKKIGSQIENPQCYICGRSTNPANLLIAICGTYFRTAYLLCNEDTFDCFRCPFLPISTF